MKRSVLIAVRRKLWQSTLGLIVIIGIIGFPVRAHAQACTCTCESERTFQASSPTACLNICLHSSGYKSGGACEPPAPSPQPTPVEGILNPKYYILTVVYAPPGSSDRGNNSSVEYGQGSTMGTTFTANDSFADDKKLSVTASVKVEDTGASASADFGFSKTTTDETSLDSKKSQTLTIQASGPGLDGIDHNRDAIYLWLNPQVNMTITGDRVAWALKTAGAQMDIQYVYVGWLKDPAQMPSDVAVRLSARNIGPSDYTQILNADVFANGSTYPDPARFQPTPTTFPYEPPYAPGEATQKYRYTLNNQTTSTSSTTVQTRTSVGVSVTGSTSFLQVWKVDAKASDTWTWTNTSKAGTSLATTESASVAVGGPSFGYEGPTDIAVYYDDIYKTFAFAPARVSTICLYGAVLEKLGKPAAGIEVLLTVQGKRRRTFTNANGVYKFYNPPYGAGRIRVAGISKNVSVVPRAVVVPVIRLH